MKKLVWWCAGAVAAFSGVRAPAGPARPAKAARFVTSPAPTAAPSAPAAGAFDWRDAVLYFVVVHRFADGNPGNNAKVDTGGRGTFHGGGLEGLRGRLDEIADLGVTALWITPVVKNIDGFVTGAGFPDWA